jgi:hypothetical protein
MADLDWYGLPRLFQEGEAEEMVKVSADVNDLVFGDYVAQISILKATPSGPVEVVKQSTNFVVPGAPAPAPSINVTIDTNA